MLENGVFNRPYVRDITKICECACSMNCDKNATELRPDRNPDIITNADRIRDMSDEELAEFLAEEQYRIANVVFQTVGYGLEKQAIYARRLDWLQQLAEEDT